MDLTRAARELLAEIRVVAHVPSNVLLTGATWAAREAVAGYLRDAGQAFVSHNFSQNVFNEEVILFGEGEDRGILSLGHGTVVFLAEIDCASQTAQRRLLKYLEDRPSSHARLVVGAKALDDAVARGEFNEALYYRLNVLQIELPPVEVVAELGRALREYQAEESRTPTHDVSITSGALGVFGSRVREPEMFGDVVGFDLAFPEDCSPADVKHILTALADYFRACGGLGLEISLQAEHIAIAELVGAPR